MILDYVEISKYILDNEPDRNYDFFNCGLRAVIENPYGPITNDFIYNLVKNWHKEYYFDESSKKTLDVCYFDEEFLTVLESKLKIRTDFLRVYSGHDNILFVSRVLTWLSEQGYEMMDHLYTIHLMSNLFDVGIARESKLSMGKNYDSYGMVYTGSLARYEPFMDTVFYTHLVKINSAYLAMQEKKVRFEAPKSGESYHLPSTKYLDW